MTGTLARLLRVAAPLKWWIALAALLGFLTVGCGIGLMSTSAYLISEAALHPSVAALGVAIVGVRFFGISRGLFRYAERYVSHYVAFGLLARLRLWFYGAVEPLAPARLSAYRSGDLLGRVVSDIETLQDFYVRVMAPPLVAALVGLAMWFFLGAYNLVFAFTLVGAYLLAGVGIPAVAYLLSRDTGRRLVAVRAELNAQLVDGIQGMADIIAFGGERRHASRVESLNSEMLHLQQRLATVNGLQTGLVNLLMNLTMWTMLVLAIPMVRDGRLDGVYLAVLALASLSSFEAVVPLPQTMQQLGASLAAARRLFEIADAAPAVREPSRSAPAPQKCDIQVRDLRFRYKAGDVSALDGITFDLDEGKCLAVVGPSGSGKTTIANLLLRFWDYSEGHVLLGGRELRDYRQEDVLSLVSVVSQSTHLFNTTIRENLLIARKAATQEALDEAARRAQVLDFIQSLPQGWATTVGEQGLRLSGGERQRLAIARAFLKDAPILVLDEPTANLDSLAEQEILRALRDLGQGRTTLIITHRLSGLEMADEIVVLRGGKIIERGRHHELVQLEGLYWKMWDLQNQLLSMPGSSSSI